MARADHQPLLRVVYCSRAMDCGEVDQVQVFEEILRQAAANNLENGITGALLAGNGWFMQAIEGPETRVRGLVEHIWRDPRHHSIEVKDARLTGFRRFPLLPMCGEFSRAKANALESPKSFDPPGLSVEAALHRLAAISQATRQKLGSDALYL